MVMALLIGGGSLILFGVFLAIGPMPILRFHGPDYRAILWDGLLSIIFFIQHSGMLRRSFRTRLAPMISRHYHPATYAIASGITLTGVLLLWQPSSKVVYQTEGSLRLLSRAISLLAIVGLVWGARTLRSLDPFGLNPIRAYLHGRQLEAPEFIYRGLYLWVRHPLYFLTLVLMWSASNVSLDRLLFNVLWTFWVVLGAYLEEKDLAAEFGEKYHQYQRHVPMLFPWRFPRGFKL